MVFKNLAEALQVVTADGHVSYETAYEFLTNAKYMDETEEDYTPSQSEIKEYLDFMAV